MHLIDRRLNPGGKSLGNRQRFLRRARAVLRDQVARASSSRSIRESDDGATVEIPADSLHEPSFHLASAGGVRSRVLTGNKSFVRGQEIPRPKGEGAGRGSGAGADGEGGDDTLRIVMSREEFLELYFEDLELPNLTKRHAQGTTSESFVRAGYTQTGAPANLAVLRTMRNGLARRLALARPKPAEIAALEEELAEARQAGDAELAAAVLARRDHAVLRQQRIPFIDPLDIRYRRLHVVPKPIARAVMFCLMDVSGSMTERMKDLARRFFSLLYIFLHRRYELVEIVFIQHTHQAEEVDEDTFFHGPRTGGTVVSTALEEMMRIVQARYSPAEWNIYAAQASDGDNLPSDGPRAAGILAEQVLPIAQYYAYIEIAMEDMPHLAAHFRDSELWRQYGAIPAKEMHFVRRRIRNRQELYPLFRDLFHRAAASAQAGA